MTSSLTDAVDRECMTRAIAAASRVRCITGSNPWVGAVVRTDDGEMFEGATLEPGGDHAEVAALRAAGERARGATLYVTLEPCAHRGRTGPCTAAIIDAGIRRVVVGIEDPDPVSGAGLAELADAGLEVTVGVQAEKVTAQLAPYLKHRRTGRPWVVLKLAATLDGGTAAPNGSSQWITSPPARVDGHRLRAESDAILVGAGTVRRDDPSLTVRDYRRRSCRAPGRWTPSGSCSARSTPQRGSNPVARCRGTSLRCSTSSVARVWSSCSSRAAPASPGTSTERAWSTATSSTSLRRCSAVTMRTASSRGPARWTSRSCGEAGSHRSSASATTCASSWSRCRAECAPATSRSAEVFTGIVEELGAVRSRQGARLRLAARAVLDDVELGASIAVNGCCLTVVAWGEDWWEADVSDETFRRTALGELAEGDPVNLERPVRLQDRLGGHLVQGHVDAVGTVVSPAPDLVVELPDGLDRYVVEKGSITVDGVSPHRRRRPRRPLQRRRHPPHRRGHHARWAPAAATVSTSRST